MPKYVLGINEGHLSTCCLLRDSQVLSCVSEERFTRTKGASGFPLRSVEFALRDAKITSQDLDLVVLGFKQLPPIPPESAEGNKLDLVSSILVGVHRAVRESWRSLEYHLPWLRNLVSISEPIYNLGYGYFANVRVEKVMSYLGIPKNRVVMADHHLCHALTAVCGGPFRNKDILVFTSDAVGDGKSASVSMVKDGIMKNLSTIHMDNSLARVYLEITRILGMKPLTDEYKVMGLAPYASKAAAQKSHEVLGNLVWFDEASQMFKSKHRMPLYYTYLSKRLVAHRFDHIAAAAQSLVEELLVKWIHSWIMKTGISTICLAGGIFMNVKANLAIMELPEIENLFVFPSAGDESIAFGAAFFGYQQLMDEGHLGAIQPLKTLYLGPSFTSDEVRTILMNGGFKENLSIEYVDDIEGALAELLSKKKIVARFKGEMEWGARALGNRSILADAADYRIVKILNKIVKQRDFWMPFAPTILWDRKEDYLLWAGKTTAPYMSIAFRSTKRAQDDIAAALHPYDHTARPQVLEESSNPSYFAILKEFESRTGRGGILNTSFNMHGEPLVCSPEDALRTFESSGLEYLALENFLISKKK